jgi:hypothetical protein
MRESALSNLNFYGLDGGDVGRNALGARDACGADENESWYEQQQNVHKLVFSVRVLLDPI